jgi:hypothetical protein
MSTPQQDNLPRGTDRVDDVDGGAHVGQGADGDTAAREEQRVALGERRPEAGWESGDDLEQAAALGETDDPDAR